jgi:hypothetical protein
LGTREVPRHEVIRKIENLLVIIMVHIDEVGGRTPPTLGRRNFEKRDPVIGGPDSALV